MTLLELKNISYRVGEKRILDRLNLKIKTGEIHFIVGVNGTGKTTLASIIMGLEEYKFHGRIMLNGKDITKLSITERAGLGITLAW